MQSYKTADNMTSYTVVQPKKYTSSLRTAEKQLDTAWNEYNKSNVFKKLFVTKKKLNLAKDNYDEAFDNATFNSHPEWLGNKTMSKANVNTGKPKTVGKKTSTVTKLYESKSKKKPAFNNSFFKKGFYKAAAEAGLNEEETNFLFQKAADAIDAAALGAAGAGAGALGGAGIGAATGGALGTLGGAGAGGYAGYKLTDHVLPEKFKKDNEAAALITKLLGGAGMGYLGANVGAGLGALGGGLAGAGIGGITGGLGGAVVGAKQ